MRYQYQTLRKQDSVSEPYPSLSPNLRFHTRVPGSRLWIYDRSPPNLGISRLPRPKMDIFGQPRHKFCIFRVCETRHCVRDRLVRRKINRGRKISRNGQKINRGLVKKLVAEVEKLVAAVEKLVGAVKKLVSAWSKR